MEHNSTDQRVCTVQTYYYAHNDIIIYGRGLRRHDDTCPTQMPSASDRRERPIFHVLVIVAAKTRVRPWSRHAHCTRIMWCQNKRHTLCPPPIPANDTSEFPQTEYYRTRSGFRVTRVFEVGLLLFSKQ